MPTRHIALVPEFGMNPSELARISAALQKQVARDLEPIWQVSATVDAFPQLEDVPAGYWPIILTFRALGIDAGIHVDRNGQPFALVELSTSWSLTASHVCLELVTDPFGSRTFPGASPRPDQGDVEFLGAICDPCEHAEFAYLINDVLVSDFCTPAYWDPASNVKERRSFTGAIQSAYQVLPGGHLSWYDPATNRWWLRRSVGGVITDVEVGSADAERGSVREFMGRNSPHLVGTKMTPDAYEARVGMRRQRALRASQSRAFWLRAAFGGVRSPEAMEFGAEGRSELGSIRPERELSSATSLDGGRAEEPMAVPVEAADLRNRGATPASKEAPAIPGALREPQDEVTQNVTADALEGEISAALERVRGEIRASVPPSPVEPIVPELHVPPPSAPAAPIVPELPLPVQPVVRARTRTLPPPLPGVLPTPLPPPLRPSFDAMTASSGPPAVATYASFGPGASIPPAAVSVAPQGSRAPAANRPKKKQDGRLIALGGIAGLAAASLVVATFAMFHGGNDAKPTAAVGASGSEAPGASAASEEPRAAPSTAAPRAAAQVPVEGPVGSAMPPAPRAVASVAAAVTTPAPAIAPPRSPSVVAVRPAAPSPRPVAATPVESVTPGLAPSVPPPAAQAARQVEPIDSLIDDRR